MVHPEDVSPFCVQQYQLLDERGEVLYEKSDNHQTRNVITFDTPVSTRSLKIRVEHPSATSPAALFEIRCYA
jgi:hypothetical protein